MDAAGYAAEAHELHRAGREQEALASAAAALRLDPNLPAVWGLIGFLLLKRGRWAEGEQYLRQGLDLADDAVMRSRLAAALMEQDKFAEALDEAEKVLAKGNSGDAQLMRGQVLCRMGRYSEAISCFEQAIAAGGIGSAAVFALGTSQFLTGCFDAGITNLKKSKPMQAFIDLPDWDGKPDPELHVVLCGEYGFGDIINFVRYAHELKKNVGRVTFDVPEQLAGLLRESFPGFGVHKRGAPLPGDIKARCFYGDLPYYLGPHAGRAFDAHAELVPYLRASEEKISFWREKLKDMPRPLIALGWAGNPRHQNDRNRSVPFAELAPLIDLAKPHLISIQRDGREQAKEAGIFDATEFIGDFADSAALLVCADLTVAVDSAPAHLAGALGLPVITLLPFDPDWRWLLGREDTIWYPAMKLYRQEKPKDWSVPLEKLCGDVKKLIG